MVAEVTLANTIEPTSPIRTMPIAGALVISALFVGPAIGVLAEGAEVMVSAPALVIDVNLCRVVLCPAGGVVVRVGDATRRGLAGRGRNK